MRHQRRRGLTIDQAHERIDTILGMHPLFGFLCSGPDPDTLDQALRVSNYAGTLTHNPKLRKRLRAFSSQIIPPPHPAITFDPYALPNVPED